MARSSLPPKARTARLPPIFTILRRRSLIELSRVVPTRSQPWVRPGSVVSRTRAIAIFSASWAEAGPACVAISSSMPTTPVARLVMVLSAPVLYAVGAMIPDRLRQVRLAPRALLLVAAVLVLVGGAAAQ